MRRCPDGGLEGDSLDGVGFVIGLRECGRDPRGADILVVGAGGVGKSVALAWADAGARRVDVANRSYERAAELVATIGQQCPSVGSKAVRGDPVGYGMVVNATTLAMRADDPLPVDPARVNREAVVAEVVMSPEITPLLENCRERGIAIHEGRYMLSGQISGITEFLLQGADAS